jgi:nicotinate-nucleotide adenylyltransferase
MKTGLYFGSFNPIHVGHLVIAGYMTEFTDIDSVWFVVSPHNPLKEKHTLLADHHRLQMVRIAIEDNNKLKASDIEFGLPVPSYTIHTLAHIAEKYPERTFVLLMGGDNLQSFHKWKNYEFILDNYEIYVYSRPGHSESLPEIASHPNVKVVDAPLMEISSSFIRDAIRNKKDIRYMLPEKVHQYVREMHFYESKKSKKS